MNNDKFVTIVKSNKYEELFNPNQNFYVGITRKTNLSLKIAMAMISLTYFY